MKLEMTAEEYLNSIPMWAGKKNSLEDIRAFLKRMGSPDEKMNIIHVAGTNGKGSVCAYMTSMLLTAGYRVGTFVSPHLVETRERFLIDGKPVGWKVFERSLQAVRELAKEMTEQGYCHPTYFEFLFYMGMDLFDRENVDVVVLETGLGGRLDATNAVLNPLVTVITSISMDHTEYLGDTIEKIAGEKAGIIKHGVPVVCENNDSRAAAVIEARAAALMSPLFFVGRQGYEAEEYRVDGIQARLKRLDGSCLSVLVPSQAEYQVMNALTALRTAEVLGREREAFAITEAAMRKGIEAMRWPGRMEEAAPGLYLDGAHNPGGVAEFSETAGRLCRESKKRAYLLFSAVSDKAHESMIRTIAQALPLDRVAVAHIRSERGLSEELLEQEFAAACDCPVTGFHTVREALLALLSWQDGGHLLFCVGSLYLMGELKEILKEEMR